MDAFTMISYKVQRYSSSSIAKFQAWLLDGVVLREDEDFSVLSRDEAEAKMREAARHGNYEVVKEIADQLNRLLAVNPGQIVSRSFRLSFKAFATLAHAALKRNSTASRLLRERLVANAGTLLKRSDFTREKASALTKAIAHTTSLQTSDSSSYSRGEYRLSAESDVASRSEIAVLLWDELKSHLLVHLEELKAVSAFPQSPSVDSDQLDALGDYLVESWTEFFSWRGNLEFAFRKESDSIELIFGGLDLPYYVSPEGIEQIGLDENQVQQVNHASQMLFKGSVDSHLIEDEACTIELPLFKWKAEVKDGVVLLDGAHLENQAIQNLMQKTISREAPDLASLDKELQAAISLGDLNTISNTSGQLAWRKHRIRSAELAFKSLLSLLEGKPAVVSFTAAELVFHLWSASGQSIDSIVEGVWSDLGQ